MGAVKNMLFDIAMLLEKEIDEVTPEDFDNHMMSLEMREHVVRNKKPTFEQIEEWWDELDDSDKLEHEKKYGIYGHDQGTDRDDIIGMYYEHFNIKGNFYATGSISTKNLQ